MLNARIALNGKWGGAAGVFSFIHHHYACAPMDSIRWRNYSNHSDRTICPRSCYVCAWISRGQEVGVGTIFSGFHDFVRGLGAYLLTTVYIILWSLLLIVPGIMAAFAYEMTYFILIDNPTMGVNEAIGMSRKMMNGNRWKYFCLSWRFIGWMLLCVVTFGIAIFWIYPYTMVTFAKFYEDIKENNCQRPPALDARHNV